MKTKILLVFFFIEFISFGQTPINSFYGANNAPYRLAVSANPLVHGSGGIDQTWNFNQLVSLGTSVHSYVAPTTQETTTYPGTTNVIVNTSTVNVTNTTSQIFTKNPANVFSITGLTSSGLTANFITNNATLGTFPMNYGYLNTDSTVAGTFVYTTYNGTFTGNLVTNVDAYGTLSLNDFGAGPYTGNVTRIKTVLNLSLTYIFPNAGTVTQTSYSYYDATISSIDPIFRSTTTTAVVPLASINQTDITLEKYANIVLNNQDFAINSIWIQNPVENSIEINSKNTIDNASISITDVLGKTLYQTKKQNIQGVFEIPLYLNKGVYIVNISNEKGSVTKKIIKN